MSLIPHPHKPADGNHHSFHSSLHSWAWRSMVSWYGQWCWTFPTWRWRCALDSRYNFFCTTETQKPFWQISKPRLKQIQIRKHRLKGGGFISPFCVGFISIAARLSGPVRTIFLLKRECSIVQQVTTVTTVTTATTGTGTLFAYVNLPSQTSSMSKASPSMLYVSCRYRRIVFLLPWT